MPTRIDVARAMRLVAGGAPLFDVLPATIFVQEHLPEAQNLPLETLDRRAVEGLDRTKPVVVYCFDQH